jgi:chaperonin cofactor prefoldin
MAIRQKSELALKEYINKMKDKKSELVKQLSEVNQDLSNLQTRKSNLQTSIADVTDVIDIIKQDLADGGIPT